MTKHLLSLGFGLFCGLFFPSLNGPYNFAKDLRDGIGKPFSCPTCASYWGIILAEIFQSLFPKSKLNVLLSGIAMSGFALTILHVIGYNIIYQGMEDT